MAAARELHLSSIFTGFPTAILKPALNPEYDVNEYTAFSSDSTGFFSHLSSKFIAEHQLKIETVGQKKRANYVRKKYRHLVYLYIPSPFLQHPVTLQARDSRADV